jgi:hypothetical protein
VSYTAKMGKNLMGSVSFWCFKEYIRQKVRKEGLLKVYKMIVILSLLYSCDTRAPSAHQIKTAAAEMGCGLSLLT